MTAVRRHYNRQFTRQSGLKLHIELCPNRGKDIQKEEGDTSHVNGMSNIPGPKPVANTVANPTEASQQPLPQAAIQFKSSIEEKNINRNPDQAQAGNAGRPRKRLACGPCRNKNARCDRQHPSCVIQEPKPRPVKKNGIEEEEGDMGQVDGMSNSSDKLVDPSLGMEVMTNDSNQLCGSNHVSFGERYETPGSNLVGQFSGMEEMTNDSNQRRGSRRVGFVEEEYGTHDGGLDIIPSHMIEHRLLLPSSSSHMDANSAGVKDLFGNVLPAWLTGE
ncbi:Uu.00g134030.m01.CDS01 [Anthostomella pinea]|uniref:Uu.00g134030.m01.CDS01 n=1 Tax=Anthostomella pinea TaxID=933095 RepID=A0AAI8VPJ1_9PEZI|nr:Uu.00g134030.m01.CDS01 [Anthostomella pinea]